MPTSPQQPLPVRAVLFVDAATSHGDSVLRLDPTGVDIPIAAACANLLRALVERAQSETKQRSRAWSDRHALARAFQVVFGEPITRTEAEFSLDLLAETLSKHGLAAGQLIERNRKTGDFRLRRGLQLRIDMGVDA